MQVINSSASQELDIVPEDEIIKQSVRIHKDVTNQNPAKSTLSVPGMGDSQGRSPSGGKKLTYKGKTLRPDKTGSDFNKKSFFKLFSSTKYFGQDDDSHQQDVAENSATLLKNLEEIYERRKNQEVLQDQVLSKEQQELDNLLISMMLCHEATKKEIQIEANNKYNMTKQKISIFDYQGQSREEHSIVLLAHLLGYTFRQLPTYDGQYSSFECGIMDQLLQYEVIGINNSYNKRERVSVVVKDPIDKKYYIYCKGRFDAMKDALLINSQDLENLQALVEQNRKQGVSTIIYGRSPVTEPDALQFQVRYQKLK